MITVAQLRAADPTPYHQAAAAWDALAADLDRGHAALTVHARALAAEWSGAAADAAAHRLGRQSTAVADASFPARRIAYALREHAYGVEALRRLAWQELTAAESRELVERAMLLDRRTAADISASRPPAQTTGHDATSAAGAGRPRSPAEVRSWWEGLGPAGREDALRSRPEEIGWLDGIPAADRDRANRLVLDRRLEELELREAQLRWQLDESRRSLPMLLMPPLLISRMIALDAELDQALAERAGLEAVRRQLSRFGDQALLLGIDADRVVVAVGDPDRARHAAVFVPGMNTDLLDIDKDLARVAHLRRAADALTPERGDVSVIYWLGYDAPTTTEALSYDASRTGARQLTPFLDGLHATHQGSPAHVTAVGHSYGSTVIAEAALGGGLHVDDIIAAGSPGMHTGHAADLRLDPRHVWGGLAQGDLVGSGLGELGFVHGQEPTDPAFGANRFVVDTYGHSDYWAPGSVSLRNQAAIIVGRYDLVSYVAGGPPTP